MAWILSGHPKTHKVTKALATSFMEMDAAPQQRPLKERRLQVYEKIARDGGFRPVTWAKAHCKETDNIYRVNGTHTSTLFSGLPLGDIPDIYAIIEEYKCDTLEDVARLYATFDSKMQTRNSGDINLAFAGTIPELLGIHYKTINLIVAGLAANEFGVTSYTTKQAPERAELLFDNVDFALWAKENFITGKADVKFLNRVGVMAAMKACYDKSKKAATEFWFAVRDQSGGNQNLPDRQLAKWLMLVVADWGTTETARRGRLRVDSRELYSRCVLAWNAWRRNEDRTRIQYFRNAKVPSAV